jgi:hypothetical protein
MKRALRLVYGCDGETPAEVAPLLLAKDDRQSKITLQELCNQAMQSLVLLSSKELNSSSDQTESHVKFTTNKYVPMSFFRSLMQLLDAESISNLACTSKAFKTALHSQSSSYPRPSMPVYCIDTVQLSKKIQHLEETNAGFHGETRWASDKHLVEHNDSSHPLSCTNRTVLSSANCSVFVVGSGVMFIVIYFLSHNLFSTKNVLALGLLFLIVVYYLHKRFHGDSHITTRQIDNHYDSI